MAKNESDQLQTLDKGLDVLLRLTQREDAISVGQLANETGFNKSTTFRILRTLQRRGFVSQLSDGRYEVRVEMFQLMMDSLSTKTSLQRIAHPELEQLAIETSETVTLSSLIRFHAQCLDKVDSQSAVYVTHVVGRLSLLHAAATGKAILAFLEPLELEKYFKEQELTQFTSATLTDRDALVADLNLTKTRGYAVSHGELDRGVSGVAAPLFNRRGKAVGSVAILGISEEFTPNITAQYGRAVLKTALAISKKMGYVQSMQQKRQI